MLRVYILTKPVVSYAVHDLFKILSPESPVKI